MNQNENFEDQLLPGERERPTLKTIARLAGLAVPTVSRALSDAPDIRADTKDKVRAIANTLGYRPNRAGLRLRTGKTNVIAVVFRTEDDIANHGFRMITAVATALRKTPYHVIYFPYFPDEDPLSPIRYITSTGSADGVIINRIQPDDPRVDYLRERNMPFAMHGRTRSCDDIPWFDFDNAEFARIGVERLAKRGRKNIVLLAPPQDQNYARLMIQGAREAAKDHGVSIDIMNDITSDAPSDLISEATQARLRAQPETDAIISPSVPACIATCVSAEATGRVVGTDIDLLSKEGASFLTDFRKNILVINEDFTETGSFLARAVLQAIEHPDKPPMQKLNVPQSS